MTWRAWLSLGVELLIIGIVLGALARISGRIYRLIRAEIRTWRIQQEKDAIWQIERQRLVDMPRHDRQRFVNAMNSTRIDHVQLVDLLSPELKRYAEAHARAVGAACGVSEKDMDFITRKKQLDGLATASDKASRRIVH